MPKYIRKPIEVEAVQWTGDNLEELRTAFPDCNFSLTIDTIAEKLRKEGFGPSPTQITIDIGVSYGAILAEISDWIVKDRPIGTLVFSSDRFREEYSPEW